MHRMCLVAILATSIVDSSASAEGLSLIPFRSSSQQPQAALTASASSSLESAKPSRVRSFWARITGRSATVAPESKHKMQLPMTHVVQQKVGSPLHPPVHLTSRRTTVGRTVEWLDPGIAPYPPSG